jgi:hypothetical protein
MHDCSATSVDHVDLSRNSFLNLQVPATNCLTASAIAPGLSHKWGMKMIKKLLGAAALFALTMSVMPANAAKMHGIGCSGPNLEKTETAIEAMADGDSKFVAEKEIAAAQEALLSGKSGACTQHLSKAAQAAK